MRETWWLAPDADAVLSSAGLVSVAACMQVAARGTLLSSDRQSVAFRLAGSPPLLVKWRRPRPGRRWRTWGRASRERREAEASLAAARLGVPVPGPLAAGERRRGAELVGSVLVRPFLDGHETARALLARDGREAWEERLATVLARWHAAGFRHGDCYPKNVLVEEATGEARPIGAPYARVTRPGSGLDRARLRDLAQWAAGLAELSGTGTFPPLAFLAPYARAAGLGGSPTEGVRPLFEAIRARKARRRATQAGREAAGPLRPEPLPPDVRPVPRRVRPLGG